MSQAAKESYMTFNDFMSLPVLFYHTIGIDPYESSAKKKTSSLWIYTKFVIHIANLNFGLGLEIAFIYQSFINKDNFIEACMVMGYIGFVIVGELKMITVWWQKPKLNALVREMESIFPPQTPEDHEQYKVEYYVKKCQKFTKGFTFLYMLLILVYNLYFLVHFLIQRWVLHLPHAKMVMPYTPISPWDLSNSFGFAVMYCMQSLAGYTCTAGHLSADLLIYGVVMQDIMHFDFLSKSLKELKIQTGNVDDGYAKDLKVLQHLISYHNKLLGVTDVINKVFGVPLLLNFMASSTMVCFVGFQMTIGLSPEQICKLAVLLVAATVEIYLLCFFSDALINASEGISSAVYEMDWFDADTRFKKMLIIVAIRAQKPVCLKATVFLDISMETMTMFLQMSYRFFCVLRTMYQ